MAIKCSAETTITNQIDATDLIMWYYATTLTTKPLSPSTTSASATPTGWSLIEPTITSASDLSKYIYECLQIVWGDGTCSWGDVQLSASFEAAKQAYNLAHSTASIFTTFEQTHNKTLVDTVNESSSAITTLTESHQYGGINLLSNTKSIDSSSAPYTNSNISLYSNQAPIDGESFYYCSGPKYFQIDFPTLINNQKYTLSFDISRSSNSQPVFVKIDETETNIGTAATTWTRLSHTFTASASTTNAQIRIAFDSTSSTATYIAAIRHIKLEQGSLATPWEYSSNDISTLSNTVNTVSQATDSNSSTISNLTQTLGTNANGTTKTDDIVHQVSNINQDLNGITTRVGKTEIALKGNYAVSSTAKGTANKQATISPTLANYELVQGAAITVKFTAENTAANPTLNINSTGAKPIKTYSGAALSENEYKWDAGSTMTFVYDGTNWCIQDSTELTRIKNNETLINQTANNVLIKATESDTTAAQGGQHLIQSLINVAPNGIKISADKVDIEGAAIFSENGYLSQDNINAINNESQTIYIQAVSGTSSVSGITTWVTNTGESVTQDAANLTPVWTIKRPIYRTNYPVLFVATQYKTIDGTVTCTTPLKDDTITVIDAGHITTGTIDASNITVTNLNADNITTGTINGQRIGVGSLSLDRLAEDVYTETEVNNIVDNLQTQIDGAIETWTGTNVPTLNNTPASAWTTDSIKDTHVGDVYFVVNDQSQQNGYNYRFTKTTSNGTSTYSWQLIKDNDVTNALQRLTTAEGKIGNIETFDSTVSSYMTNTDNEITSIKSAATTLSGRVDTAEGTLATKVDTSTFNTLSQTVEGNTQSISSLNTTITTKADSSTVSALQTQTNTISDTVDGHTQSISSINSTVATKADGSEVTTLSNNLSSLQQDVNGFKTTVSQTYTTKEEFENLEVGGRNLLPNSQDWSGATKRTNGTIVVTSDIYGGCSVLTHVWGSGNSDVGYQGNVWTQPIEADAWYTLSFWAKASSVIESMSYFFSSNVVDEGINSSGKTTTSTDGTIKNTITTEWQRIWVSWHIKANATSFPQQLIVARLQTQHSGVTLYLAGPKLEKGNKATDWTPAPEDIETRVSSAESAIAQNANSIALKVSESDVTGNYLVGKINLNSTTASIAAQHINLQGAVTISDLDSNAQAATLNSNISVGGSNLLLGTKDFSGWYTNAPTVCVFGDGVCTYMGVSTKEWHYLGSPCIEFASVEGSDITLSFDMRSDDYESLPDGVYPCSQLYLKSAGPQATNYTYRCKTTPARTPNVTGEWTRFSYTFESISLADFRQSYSSADAPWLCVSLWFYQLQSVQLRRFKLERGNKATDWSPAPEDVQAAVSEAAKTATNYITADSTGIKIRMSSNSTTYQHQSSTATTYYVSGNKRTVVSADGLEVFDGTYGSEESVAAFGTVARLGKATGNKVIADSTGVHIYDIQGSQVAAFGQAPGELTTTMLSDEPEIGTSYPVPSDAISDIRIMLDDQPLSKDTDYTLSSGIVTLLESTTVTGILDDSGSSGEEGSEDVKAHSLTCEYSASAGVGLAIGASVTRPGLDVAERAVFRHPSFVEAIHGTANADTGYRASRTDTGIQVFCGIGIGGVNHGVYSHVLNRWLINADRSTVHVAPHTVTDGNINIKSKYVYATTPSASKGNGWGHSLQYLDTAGGLVGVVKAYSLTTGEKGIQLQATRNIGSTTYNNGIRFGVDASGNLKLAFSGGGRLLWRQALGFDSGDVAFSYGGSDNAPKNAYRDIPVTFNFTHTYAPHVVATFSTGSTGVTMGGLSLSVHSITTTGCKIRIYNNTNDTRNPALKWVAID